MSNRIWRIAIVAVISLASCQDGTGPTTQPPPGPVAGALALRLTAPGQAAGAIMVTVSGKVDSLQSSSYRVWQLSQGNPSRYVISGKLQAGEIARAYVPDIQGAVAVTIQEVAARSTYQQLSPDSYGVTVGP